MGSSKLVNGKRITVAVVVACAVLAFETPPAHAGSLTPPAGPAEAGSAMYTIGDVYQRLSSGAAGTKRVGAFVEPTDLGATMHSLDEVMGLAPALDSTNGAAVVDVCTGKTFWGLRSGGWGTLTGTGVCTPVFLGTAGPFSVAENAAAATVVGTVTATGTGIAYSIAAGNTGGVFAINSGSGQITRSASGTIDYETTRSYSLTVRATIGAATRDVVVTVNVTDVNDTAPVFLASGPFSVADNSPVDTAVGRVVATDADSAALTYSITAGDTGAAFKIDALGQISVATAVLNFETTASYTLTVRATDGTNPTTAAVTVAVADVNEPPVVGNHALTVAQEATKVLTSSDLSATDPESTPEAQLVYTVTVLPTRGHLEVDAPSGTWTTVNSRVFFTQDDVANSRVRYVHTTANKTDDSFGFTLEDNGGASVSGTLNVTVN